MTRFGRFTRLASIALLIAGGGISCGGTELPSPHLAEHGRVFGEYIITVVNNDAESLIRQLYGEYSIEAIKGLGEDRYLLRMGQDPGPEVIKEKATKSGRVKSVQPNFAYQTQE